MGRGTNPCILGACVALALALAAPVSAFDAQQDSQNRAKSSEREREHGADEYAAEVRWRSLQNLAASASILATDPERAAGDVRLYDFQSRGRGLVAPVLWTARNGSTISGHVWATRAGPAKRPAIVITSGSVQVAEPIYWWAAQVLAKSGYVVITSDPQHQGRSDSFGDGPDRLEGFPAQTAGNTFYDGTQDALDFLLSTPERPFCAPPSRSGTSHCDKQERRVREGRNAAFNPFWDMVDPERIGLAGHSYGAAGVSWVGQQDERVDAVVAWDNLCSPNVRAGSSGGCSNGGHGDPPGFRVPSLGLTNDTFAGVEPKSSDPDPLERSRASLNFSAAGVDTGSIAIRGGTHFEYSYMPNRALRATLRGMDLAAWFTTAWFDKYVKGDPSADRRLIATRWRNDPGDLAVDPAGGGNLHSFYYRSRLDIGLDGGGRFTCEDLRTGCEGQAEDDGIGPHYSYLAIATSPDGTQPGEAVSAPARVGVRVAYRGRPCSRGRMMHLRLTGDDAAAVHRLVVRHRGRAVARGTRSARLRVARLRRSGRVTLVATLRDGRTRVMTRHVRLCGRRR